MTSFLKSGHCCGSRYLAGLLISFFLLFLASCQDIPVDRLYALHLDHPPSVSDWNEALPRLVTVRGGFVNRPKRFADIDDDTVHTTTASCHHGAALPEPVLVDMRAFYTDSDLFLRLSWADPTRDDQMRGWHYDGERWQADSAREDGFGLMWDAQGRFPQFSCSYACHIDDFGVAGASFHARNRMRLDRENVLVDLWNWKADRTARRGFVDDRYLSTKEMRPDVPGEIFRLNSVNALTGQEPFIDGDRPLFAADGEKIGERFLLADSRAPGYLVDQPQGGRADIDATSRYEDGRWVVILRRALVTGDRRDVSFIAGDTAGVAFGLSIMDNTLDQHYASVTEEKLVLLARTDLSPRSPE